MKPRRTPDSNCVFHLPGGNEDNDLWACVGEDVDGNSVIVSTWELSQNESKAIVEGRRIELIVWGSQTPPVALRVED